MTTIHEGTLEAELQMHRRAKVGSAILFLDGLGFGIVVPLLPFIALDFGADSFAATQLVAIYGLSGFLGGLAAGELCDHWGRNRVVVVTLALSVAAYIGMALANSLFVLFAFRALSGFATGRDGVLRALVTDGLQGGKHLPVLARIIAAYSLGAVLGPGIAGLLPVALGEGASYTKTLFTIAAVSNAIMLVIVRRALPIEEKSNHSARKISELNRKTALLTAPIWLAIGFLGTVAYASVVSVTALFGNQAFGWTAPETGWLLVLVSLGVFVTRSTVLPWIVAKFGDMRVLGGSIVLGILASVLASTAVHPVQFVIGVSLLAWTMSALTVIIGSLVSRRTPAAFRGFLMGVTQALSAAALVVGAIVSGLCFDAFGRGAPYAVAALLLVVAACLTWARSCTDTGER